VKTTQFIACALLIVLLTGILGTASASPLRVYAVSSETGKAVPNTQICAYVTANSNKALVWSNCCRTNAGFCSFEVPGQYTGQRYTLYVYASANVNNKKISNSYLGRFKNTVGLRMK
jgi:hypothetical protein